MRDGSIVINGQQIMIWLYFLGLSHIVRDWRLIMSLEKKYVNWHFIIGKDFEYMCPL